MSMFNLGGNRRGTVGRSTRGNAKRLRRPTSLKLHLEPLEERTLLSLSGPTPLWFGDPAAEVEAGFLAGETRAELLSSAPRLLSGRLAVPGVLIDAVSAEGAEFTRLEVPGWHTAGDMGQAGLPAYYTAFVIPGGMEVGVGYTVENTATFQTQSPVYPVHR